MEEYIKEAEALMLIDARTNYNKFQAFYIKVFRTGYNGCKCHPNGIKEAIRVWLQKNKQVVNK
jgi:hypothetical protein